MKFIYFLFVSFLIAKVALAEMQESIVSSSEYSGEMAEQELASSSASEENQAVAQAEIKNDVPLQQSDM